MKNQYNEISKNYTGVRNATQRFVWGPTLLMMTGDITGKEVLDIGCGNGYYTRILSEQDPKRIVGIDIAAEMIVLAKQESQNIEYVVGNMRTYKSKSLFDIVTAIYVINYNRTKEDLSKACRNIYKNLKSEGRFCGITTRPELKPRNEFIRQFRFTNSNGSDTFEDGDEIFAEVRNKKTGTISTFTSQYWSEETYTRALKEAGFKKIVWHYDLVISEEGKKAFDEDYWKAWKKTVSGVGFQAFK